MLIGHTLPPAARRRWLWLPPIGLALTWLLFLLVYQAIRSPDISVESSTTIESVRVVTTPPPESSRDPMQALRTPPPPPPEAPPSLAGGAAPALSLPALAVAPIDIGTVVAPVGVRIGVGNSLAASGTFGGFAGRGSGGGAGGGSGGGYGGGSWKGKPLVPLSTARPQMPEWACKQKLGGWVEAVFTVGSNGHVRDVKIADADPKGVFEAAAIESISSWLYEPTGANLEVRQRVPMDPADCVYNYR